MDPQDIQAKSERVQRLVEEAEKEVTSEKKEVTIILGPAGSIKELELSHRALRLSGSELGTMIVEALKRGRQELDAELSQEISSVFGFEEGDESVGNMFSGGLADAADLFETQKPEDKKL